MFCRLVGLHQGPIQMSSLGCPMCPVCPRAQCAMHNVLFVHWEFWGTALVHRTAHCAQYAMQQMYIVIDCIGGQYRCLFPAFDCPMYNSMKHNFMCCNILTTIFVCTLLTITNTDLATVQQLTPGSNPNTSM